MVVKEVKFFAPLLFFASNFQCEEAPLSIDCSLNITVIMNSFFHNFMGHSLVKLLLY